MKIDIAIIGAQKAGTTSLFNYLKQHPALLGHEQREMTYFFDDEEYATGEHEGLARYFPDETKGASFNGGYIVKHVLLMRSPTALDRLKRHNPQCRLVCVLRDPVKRAYSAYQYAQRRSWQEKGETFDEIVGRLIDQDGAENAVSDIRLDHLRRSDRQGFKAGALQHGLSTAVGEFIAIFDADFIPPSDFLEKTIPHFADPVIGCVQAR